MNLYSLRPLLRLAWFNSLFLGKRKLSYKPFSSLSFMSNTMPSTVKRQRSLLCRPMPVAILLSAAFFIGSAFIVTDYKERFSGPSIIDEIQGTRSKICENQCRPDRSEALPKGIVSRTSDLEMRPLWGPPNKRKNSQSPKNLLAMAVGKKQKGNVNEIVKKFPSNDFVVMLFHYDGIVDDWRDLEWSSRAIHVSAISQTKWWFAKRFLHPDVVSEYDYIFLWDEDLGVQNFHVGRYLSIIKEEGLHISQPALDPYKSEVHHRITLRKKGHRVHRWVPWVEMMAPVFSSASWRCAWYMIQNDLIHGWGLDMQLGYCAQGDRTKNIGIVDSEYVVHYGLPTLGGSAENTTNAEAPSNASPNTTLPNKGPKVSSAPHQSNDRHAVRRQSYIELEMFKSRWKKAVGEDECWADPYEQPAKQNI